MYMVLGDKNYVGPVQQILNFPSRRRKQILDIGTGSGLWSVIINRTSSFRRSDMTGPCRCPTNSQRLMLWGSILRQYNQSMSCARSSSLTRMLNLVVQNGSSELQVSNSAFVRLRRSLLNAHRRISFELFDAQLLPYSNETFDIVHVRAMHTGVSFTTILLLS